ncbi:heptatricopeptide repeat-containing protein, putative [Plasmodium yoelii]|uniref:Heptatricopeptide repeat-containing protein n=2 Tax=Plasmodium yoelii TaxID=5861 RepID=A0AAF0AYM5_PLAYO|nr:heptatricopeptide repeat-containing protein, putative [Plasmodium yoelii]WBY55332.1 heptatricopeptide repeat-containing protein [Plasmodium yoelii yoelii]CDU16502.1 conserved Plasmodium protein, unknown function [Plasmodium yoelii]VTZ73344.1 heptatricopeptide repeat-containing protein, putative [Plasmodium yoelii]|eukprot:XP_729510.2 heptatricopeptide repeat-containing protein, putative [Plasmodium yoelii]
MLKHIYLRIINVEKSLKKININNKLDSNLKHSKFKDNLYEQIYKKKKNNFSERDINNYHQIENENTLLEKCTKTCDNYNSHTFINLSNNRNDKIGNILNMESVENVESVENAKNAKNVESVENAKNVEKCEEVLLTQLDQNVDLKKRQCTDMNKLNIQSKMDELNIILNYSSIQVIKSLNVKHNYINCKEYFMSLSLICNQLAIYNYKNPNFWKILSIKLIDILKIKNIYKTFCIRWLALILNSFGRVHFLNKTFMKSSAIYIQNYKVEDMHSFDISQIVNSYSKLNYIDYNLFKYFEKIIYNKINELSYQSISNICNAYSKLNPNDTKIYNILINKIKKNIDKFNEQELANILSAYSKLNIKDFDLFNKSLEYIFHKFYNFKPIEIVMITNAYSKCNINNKTMVSYLLSYMKKYYNLFEPPELAIIANACANWNIREYKIFDIIKKGIIKKEHMLENGNVAMLLHAYGKLLIRDEYFILNIIKKKKHIISYLDSRNLTLFYVSIIKLNIDIPIEIYNNLKLNISKKLHTFTDLALVSICYSSMFYMYFDIKLISSILFLLNKRKASSRSFAHQIHVSLFVLQSIYDFYNFSFKFIICLNALLTRAYHYISQKNYYDINKSAIQKRIYPFIPKKKNITIQSEVAIGPFVVDFLLLSNDFHQYQIEKFKSIK